MFYKPVWAYQGFQLVVRPDTPNYHITWCKPGSSRLQRRSTRTDDLEDAKRKLIRFADTWGSSTPADPSEVVVLEVLCDYVERKLAEGCSPHSLTNTLREFTTFVEVNDLTYVSECTVPVFEAYAVWRRSCLKRKGHGASNGTINRELGVVRAALRDAWKRGRLSTVPFVPLLQAPEGRSRFLSPDEVRRLFDACDTEHLHLYLMLALHTLQRPISLFQLNVDQIDFDRNRIDFLPAGSSQSNKRRPVVPITRTLRPHLEQAAEMTGTGFLIEWKRRPIRCVRTSFNSARRWAGFGTDVVPYTLRHTGATLMAAGGVPLRQISGMLGHSQEKTTELYAKHQPEFLADAADALDRIFGQDE